MLPALRGVILDCDCIRFACLKTSQDRAVRNRVAFEVGSLTLSQVPILPLAGRTGVACRSQVCTLVKVGCRLICECRCDHSASLLPAGDDAVCGNKVRWQIEGIINRAIPCNRNNHIPAPGVPYIVIHKDANLRITLPVRACQCDSRTWGIIR